MNFIEKDFLPVLFGNDINVYSLSRAFYEAYGIRSKAFGQATKSTCYKSKLVDFTEVKNLTNDDIFVETVTTFANSQNKTLLLLGCGDNYVKCITKNRTRLPENIIVPYGDYTLLENLMDKDFFYALCEEHGIDYPKTFALTKEQVYNFTLPFSAPYVLKPSNQVDYYNHKFDGQKKVFIVDTFEELKEVAEKVYSSGYEDILIIQEFIPGDDTNMRVLTSYSDKNGQVKLMCLGHVLLEEHTPYGIGNHAVIINEYNKELMETFKNLLETIGFTGFSNFDIKYDPRDGKFKAFELNVRQGRSNYYVTGAGHNITKYVVEDYIYNQELVENIAKNEHLWMVVPKKVAFTYASGYREKMKALIAEGKYVNPLYFKKDNNMIRMLHLYKSQYGHIPKFKKYTRKL